MPKLKTHYYCGTPLWHHGHLGALAEPLCQDVALGTYLSSFNNEIGHKHNLEARSDMVETLVGRWRF